jgi:TATA-binding protein-associated factor Taf7
MTLKRIAIAGALWLALAGAGVLLAQTSSTTASETSLGDLARQLRAQRAASAQKAKKVYTNDNLPARSAGGGVSVAATISAEVHAPSQLESAEASAGVSGESSAAGGPGGHDEKYYRKAAGEIRARLDQRKRELAVLEQKLAQGSMQFYADPNQTLQQEFSRSDINKLQADIEKKKEQIAAEERAMSDLEDQLRREGAPPGWLR